ncbi:MAG: hypothetical protein ACM33T_15660 [Solirubrobacterales bacterium]
MKRIVPACALAVWFAGGHVLAQSSNEKWQARKIEGATIASLVKQGYELKAVVRIARNDDIYFLQKGPHLVRCLDSSSGPAQFLECQEFVEPFPAPLLR